MRPREGLTGRRHSVGALKSPMLVGAIVNGAALGNVSQPPPDPLDLSQSPLS